MRWKCGPLRARKCATQIGAGETRRGQCVLEGARSPLKVWEYMTDPVLRLMEKALIKKGKRHLTGYVPNYFCLRLAGSGDGESHPD